MFFSLNNVLGFIILLVTFFSPIIGLCGASAVLLINIIAYKIGFNREEIKSGLFGFNALFLGMALAEDYQINSAFIILFLSSVLCLLLITVWLKGLLANYNVPFLSFPFIITFWVVSYASSSFTNIVLDESSIYTFNELAKNESSFLYQTVHALDNIVLPEFVLIYFKTLSGTFFQTSVLAGILISLGLIYSSRISFSLSVIGFSFAYFFYYLFGADINDLNNNLIGVNFMFLAIGIGCFFLIPSTHSYIAVISLMPILILVSLFLGKVLLIFQLKAYTLSFSIVCTAFLYCLNQRWFQAYLQIVTIQYFSAEKTIYYYLNSIERFNNEHLYKISLPFYGEWTVSQGYDGKITHLGDWSKALDFVITDSKNNTYKEPTLKEKFSRDNFYCYNKEIYAPYDGYIYDIVDYVEENDIGEVNTDYNWGNTIIINHLNGLFSAISHIKKDSINVVIGQYVYKGAYLATCGNSGRSPEPHIHFQLQTLPTVGAKTLSYPISYFIERIGSNKYLKISEVPKENALISNVQVSEQLSVAFSFIPGQTITFKNDKTNELNTWEVYTDAFNRLYFYCKKYHSKAYFVNDGIMFYFTEYEGDKNSLLFQFYIANYRQLLGYYDNITINDKVPIIHFTNKFVQFFQDFLAPFYLFTQVNQSSSFSYADNIYAPQHIICKSKIETTIFNNVIKHANFEIEVKHFKIQKFTIHNKNTSQSYSHI